MENRDPQHEIEMETKSPTSSACTCTAECHPSIPRGRSQFSPYLTNQPPTVPQTASCSPNHLITHPLTASLALLVAFGLLVYGLYLLTPNLHRPKQKPLRLTPLVEYNLAFDRLVEDLKRVVELGGHEEVVREYERCGKAHNARKDGFGTLEHLKEVLEGLRSLRSTGQGKYGDGTRMSEWAVRESEDLTVGAGESKRERVGLSRRAATY